MDGPVGAPHIDLLKSAAAGLRRTRRISYMMSGWFETASLGDGAGGTAAVTIGCPDDFVAVRLGFPNMSAKPWTIKKIIGCSSWTFNDFIHPTGNAEWVPFTFAAGGRDSDQIVTSADAPQEITVGPARDSDGRPAWTWTDWAPIASISPRAGPGLRVLMLRALIPSGQDVCYAVGQMRGLLGNADLNSGFEYFIGGIKFNLDHVNDTSGREPTMTWIDNQLAAGSMFPMVQFLTRNAGLSGIVAGDSHQQGTATTEQFNNFFYRAVTRQIDGAVSPLPFGMVNCAAGGLTSDDFFARMDALLAPVRPSYAILPGWTYNDSSGDVHADTPAMRIFFARLIAAAERCSALGIRPVFMTPFPRDAERMGAAQLAPWLWLRQSILDLRKSGELVFDTSAVLGNRVNGQFDGTYLPSLSNDAAHPNDAGHAAVADLLAEWFGAVEASTLTAAQG